MAQKRMFSLNVVDTDKFLEMPVSARLLYYELGMRADDDGFVDNWKKILLFTGLKEDDMKLLILKSFIIPFESGVIVIRHWRMNNYLQKDRKKDTNYQEELEMLDVSNGGEYFLKKTPKNKGMKEICIQNDDNMYTQYSIDKYSIDNNNNIYAHSKNEQESDKKKEQFEIFYKEYPKKVGKKNAEKSFNKIKMTDELYKLIITNLKKQKEIWEYNKTEKQYIPYPSTWLNQERWNDELIKREKTKEEKKEEIWNKLIEEERINGYIRNKEDNG